MTVWYMWELSEGEDQPLPLGCQIMGEAKIHKENKKGQGVRVAVIDSGGDDFGSAGEPWNRTDHGTYVAGTIHTMAPEAEIYDYRSFGEEAAFEIDDAIVASIFEAWFRWVRRHQHEFARPLAIF